MDQNLAVGALVSYGQGFAVIGNCCLGKSEVEDHQFTPVFYVNIGPVYSQHCLRCNGEIVHGTSSIELFDGK